MATEILISISGEYFLMISNKSSLEENPEIRFEDLSIEVKSHTVPDEYHQLSCKITHKPTGIFGECNSFCKEHYDYEKNKLKKLKFFDYRECAMRKLYQKMEDTYILNENKVLTMPP